MSWTPNDVYLKTAVLRWKQHSERFPLIQCSLPFWVPIACVLCILLNYSQHPHRCCLLGMIVPSHFLFIFFRQNSLVETLYNSNSPPSSWLSWVRRIFSVVCAGTSSLAWVIGLFPLWTQWLQYWKIPLGQTSFKWFVLLHAFPHTENVIVSWSPSCVYLTMWHGMLHHTMHLPHGFCLLVWYYVMNNG